MFDLEGFRLDVAQAELLDVTRPPFKRSSLFDAVKEYLVHYAYVETL